MDREFPDELIELIQANPEHLVVLPMEQPRWWHKLPLANLPPVVWLICHASIDEAGEYDLRPIAEVIGPGQRLQFKHYNNPLINLREED
jgi:hypothetical protein